MGLTDRSYKDGDEDTHFNVNSSWNDSGLLYESTVVIDKQMCCVISHSDDVSVCVRGFWWNGKDWNVSVHRFSDDFGERGRNTHTHTHTHRLKARLDLVYGWGEEEEEHHITPWRTQSCGSEPGCETKPCRYRCFGGDVTSRMWENSVLQLYVGYQKPSYICMRSLRAHRLDGSEERSQTDSA